MESFWKEYTIFLPAKKEFVYDIQNENTNCVIIRNYNITNVKAGLKPHTYELFINPNRIGILNRPFPLNYVYLIASKSTPVSIIETITQNPIANFIRQGVTKNVSIDIVNTIIQNTPLKICQLDALRPNVKGRLIWPPYRHRTEFIFDLGGYSAPNIYLLLRSNIGSKCRATRRHYWNSPLRTSYRIYALSENTRYIRLVHFVFPSQELPPELIIDSDNIKFLSINAFRALLSFNNNTFRFISIVSANASTTPADRIVIPIR